MRMRFKLEEHGLWQVVDEGAAEAPAPLASDASAAARTEHAAAVLAAKHDRMLDRKAVGLIGNHVLDMHGSVVAEAASAKAAWSALKAIFSQQSVARQAQLQDQLHNLLKGDTESVGELYSRTRQLWAELKAADCPTPERQVVLKILQALPDSFAHVVEIIKFTPGANPTLDSMQVQLLQWEQDQLQQSSRQQLGLMAMGGRFGKGRGSGQVQGRAAATQSSNPPTAHAGSKGVCHYCGKAGHFKAECRKRIREQGQSSGGRGGRGPGAGGSGTGASSSTTAVLSASLLACAVAPPVATPVVAMASLPAFMPAASAEQFIIDSGASRHVVRNEGVLFDYSHLSPPITVNLGKAGVQMQAVGQGTVHVSTSQGDFSLSNVLHVPEAAGSFVSVSAATASSCRVVFDDNACELQGKEANAGFRLRAVQQGGMYAFSGIPMRAPAATPAVCASSSNAAVTPQVWHQRTGHASYSLLSRMQRMGMVQGVEVSAQQFTAADSEPGVCAGCALGKQHRKVVDTLPNNEPAVTRPLALVHMDVCGPISQPARDGSRYFATFLDDYTGLSVVVMLKQKSDVPAAVQHVVALLEKQSGHQVLVLRSDNGSEYFNGAMRSYCSSKGIKQQHSAPYSPEQNGSAERLNRSLQEKARSMLHMSGLAIRNYAEAIRLANLARNMLPVTGKQVTPLEAFSGVKPDLSFLRVFGATAWVHVPQTSRTKFGAKAVMGKLVGYENGAKAYRVLVGDRVLVSKDVQFDERAVVAGELSILVPEDPDSDIEDRDEALQPDLTEAQQNRRVSGEARAARDRDNTYHGRKCKIAHLIDHLPQELWDAFLDDAVQQRVEAISERAVLASLLFGLLVRGLFTIRVADPLGLHDQPVYTDIPVSQAAIPDLSCRNLFLQLVRGLLQKSMQVGVRLSPRTLVVSLDIGTHGSGFAFATKPATGTRSPVKLHEAWPDQRVSYCKARSALLYRDRSPVAWGDSALQKLYELEASGQDMSQYHLVESFKLSLHEPERAAVLPQGLRPEMVMADYLTFLRKYALDKLAAEVGHAAARLDNIQWCLTVPAMWSEASKALMRTSALRAGLIRTIESDALTIILEPEAAALHALDKQAPPLVAGMSVMVLDVGGGTADATVHNCQALGGQVVLSEATCAEGALCGSVYVDKEFRSFYRDTVGAAAFDTWAVRNPSSLQQVMDRWEAVKCSFASNHSTSLADSLGQLGLGADGPGSGEVFRVSIPPDLQRLMALEQQAVIRQQQQGQASELVLSSAVMRQLFQGPVEEVLLVGGFARSSYLQARVRAAVLGSGLADKVVVPPAPHAAVLGGAVVYGFNPARIHARRSRLAYGVKSCARWVDGAPGKFQHRETKEWMTNCYFNRFVKKMELVSCDQEVEHTFWPLYKHQTMVSVALYACDDNACKFVEDDNEEMKQIGTLDVEVPDHAVSADEEARAFTVRFKFGQTAINVSGCNEATRSAAAATITFAHS
ncbi:hypothetical protein QJQ45_023653 [Haematococcus lacustris]|nr:hypothetical protein QJQ45_023653 [Haematococcus lacustris]